MKNGSPHFLGYTVKWFILDAMYLIDEYKSRPLKIFLYFWRSVCGFLILSCIIGNCMMINNNFNEDFSKYAMNYMNTCIYIGCFARLMYYYLFDWKTHDLVAKINLVFIYEARNSMVKNYTVRRYVKQVYYMTKYWIIYTTFTVMFMILLSVLFSTNTGRTLPFTLWYPYDWKVSPFYELSVLHQTLSQLVMSSTYGNSDLFFVCSSLLLAGQFDLLGYEFSNVFYKVLLKHGINKEDAVSFRENCGRCKRVYDREATEFSPPVREDFARIYGVIYTKKFNDDLMAEFSELIRFHQALLSVCDDVKSFFDPLQLFLFLFYIVYLTLMTFILATSKNTSLLVSCGEYLVAASIQLYLITYFGDVLTSQAEQLPYDLYEFPWYLCSKKLQTTFRFVHMRGMKPVHLSIGKFGIVSLSTFVLTLRTSFSYFTVLRQIVQEE